MNLDRLFNECDPAPAGSLGGRGIDDALDALGSAIVGAPRPAARGARGAGPPVAGP